jgi:GDP-L-fucose synthase
MDHSAEIVVTGGTGFLGKRVIRKLCNMRYDHVFPIGHNGCDLRNWDDCDTVVSSAEIVIHLAANVGGIGYNLKNPGSLFYDNAVMGLQMMEAARQADVKKFVAVGTVCAYPKFAPVPFREEDLWNGYPEETNAPYGLAKKMLLVQSQAYRWQYCFNSIYLLPVNLYGPGDNFDPDSSHVIPR